MTRQERAEHIGDEWLVGYEHYGRVVYAIAQAIDAGKAEAVAAERERCAKIAEAYAADSRQSELTEPDRVQAGFHAIAANAYRSVAAAIREGK